MLPAGLDAEPAVYGTLDPTRIITTLELLERRIVERFPGASLAKVCAELTRFAAENSSRVARIAKPNLALRVFIAAFVAISVAALAYVGQVIEFRNDGDNLSGIIQGIDAFINIVIVVGAAVLFLVTIEDRLRRRRALTDLHGLRSIIHVIDMHQLPKDPSQSARIGAVTPSSPKRTLSPHELTRYLDYCSEMLSLAAKTAALYAQAIPDSVVIEAVGDIERLTSGLSAKIWQKIMIVEQDRAGQGARQQTPAARSVP